VLGEEGGIGDIWESLSEMFGEKMGWSLKGVL